MKKKYRIKKVYNTTTKKTIFYPQFRTFLIWINFSTIDWIGDCGTICYKTTHFSNYVDAEKAIHQFHKEQYQKDEIAFEYIELAY